MSFQSVIQAVNTGKLSSVYFVHGSEHYLSREFFTNLFKSMGNKEELDIINLDFTEVGMGGVLEEANTFSFFADLRIIIVDKADFVTTASGTKLDKQDETALIDYLKTPNTASILIFTCDQDSLDKRRKVVKQLQKSATWLNIIPLDQQAVDRYVKEYLKDASLKLSREAIDELLDRVNYQLTNAMGEIHKLETFQQSGQQIGVEEVRKLVPRTLESDIFKLSNAVVAKQIDAAIQIYQDLILMKHEPIALHALLISQFRIMVQSKILLERGLSQGKIAQHLGVHPYRVQLACQNVQGISMSDLLDFYQELVKVDHQMKTGIGVKESYFYLLLTQLVHI